MTVPPLLIAVQVATQGGADLAWSIAGTAIAIAIGIAGWAVRSVLKGRLGTPAHMSHLEDQITRQQEEIASRDDIIRARDETVAELMRQNGALIEVNRVNASVMEALRSVAEHPKRRAVP